MKVTISTLLTLPLLTAAIPTLDPSTNGTALLSRGWGTSLQTTCTIPEAHSCLDKKHPEKGDIKLTPEICSQQCKCKTNSWNEWGMDCDAFNGCKASTIEKYCSCVPKVEELSVPNDSKRSDQRERAALWCGFPQGFEPKNPRVRAKWEEEKKKNGGK